MRGFQVAGFGPAFGLVALGEIRVTGELSVERAAVFVVSGKIVDQFFQLMVAAAVDAIKMPAIMMGVLKLSRLWRRAILGARCGEASEELSDGTIKVTE